MSFLPPYLCIDWFWWRSWPYWRYRFSVWPDSIWCWCRGDALRTSRWRANSRAATIRFHGAAGTIAVTPSSGHSSPGKHTLFLTSSLSFGNEFQSPLRSYSLMKPQRYAARRHTKESSQISTITGDRDERDDGAAGRHHRPGTPGNIPPGAHPLTHHQQQQQHRQTQVKTYTDHGNTHASQRSTGARTHYSKVSASRKCLSFIYSFCHVLMLKLYSPIYCLVLYLVLLFVI